MLLMTLCTASAERGSRREKRMMPESSKEKALKLLRAVQELNPTTTFSTVLHATLVFVVC